MFKEMFTESYEGTELEEYLKVLMPDDKTRNSMRKWFTKWKSAGLYVHQIEEKMAKKFKGKAREQTLKEFVSRLYVFPDYGPGQFD